MASLRDVIKAALQCTFILNNQIMQLTDTKVGIHEDNPVIVRVKGALNSDL